jgi:hypothetical protein
LIPDHVGRDDITERDLFTLELRSPEDHPGRITLSSPRFACLVAWDASEVSSERIAALARKLLDSGAVYICAWGPNCERVHDIIDEEEVGPNPPTEVDRVVMTTWHSGEPLAEAIWFVLHNSWPDEAYAAGCGATLGVAIGSPAWAAEIHTAFSNPREFSAQVLARK